jgi:hypothetical protein
MVFYSFSSIKTIVFAFIPKQYQYYYEYQVQKNPARLCCESEVLVLARTNWNELGTLDLFNLKIKLAAPVK